MRILMINKFLYPNGGAETYLFRLGEQLRRQGHEVQYFGMDHENRILGNRAEAYTRPMDFHGGTILTRLSYGLRTIYSREARKKLRLVLEDFRPEACHLNNFHYQLTPSILMEIRKWSRETRHPCRVVYTAHDYQLVCPNHMCRNGKTGQNCEQRLDGHFLPCVRNRCVHGSYLRSAMGMLEAVFWKKMGIYRQLDQIICCSHFLKTKLDRNPILAEKTVVMHNFAERVEAPAAEKKGYALYFGRYSREKGIQTLIQAAKRLPQIPIVCAGAGPLEEELAGAANLHPVGYQSGEALKTWIREARFTICPSECYENCPFSVLESLSLGTPVLAANIGGIPELVREGQNGALFESGNASQLAGKMRAMWERTESGQWPQKENAMGNFPTLAAYGSWLEEIYAGAVCHD